VGHGLGSRGRWVAGRRSPVVDSSSLWAVYLAGAPVMPTRAPYYYTPRHLLHWLPPIGSHARYTPGRYRRTPLSLFPSSLPPPNRRSRILYDKRIAAEVEGEGLGDEVSLRDANHKGAPPLLSE